MFLSKTQITRMKFCELSYFYYCCRKESSKESLYYPLGGAAQRMWNFSGIHVCLFLWLNLKVLVDSDRHIHTVSYEPRFASISTLPNLYVYVRVEKQPKLALGFTQSVCPTPIKSSFSVWYWLFLCRDSDGERLNMKESQAGT